MITAQEAERRATLVASRLAAALNAHVGPEQRGVAVVGVPFRLPPQGTIRQPDVALVAYDAWPSFTALERVWEGLAVVPPLVAEVARPTTTLSEVCDKIHDYFTAGVRLVWVVLPRFRRAYVYDSLHSVCIRGQNSFLDGADVLSGFHLPLAELFALPLHRPLGGEAGKEGSP